MLEVKHLFKEYKSKKGVTTKALDDVSLVFPEKGMVFILGKSGSGKSTLLNVCGGLDRADSGEIIIKGKSSKDFSGQDFDSYRNTYVGFVFQEYNILDEFTVEENIALALELQNKKRDRETIDKILNDVDLAQFASRKPNTLSGGQKQRVAIARALVKEPEIIMADEPTGALDSKTGQQVFDTLKKLSQDKLVLVISHDRDFAEQYADRIIELKDGKILSDMTRSDDPELNKNLQFFGTDTVCIKNGANITDDELKKIAAFLSKANGTAVISTSREKINDFKQDRPEMDVGEFQNIKEQPKSKEYEPQKLIRSHLPLRHAIKVGAGGLKTKPVRLVFTILLSVIAFVMFGLMSTVMMFNERNVTKQTLMSMGYSYISLGNTYKVHRTTYHNDEIESERDSYFDTKFTEADLEKIAKEFGDVLAVYSSGNGISLDNVSISSNAAQFYSDNANGFILATERLQKLYGNYPTTADEVMISSFLFDSLKLETTKFTDANGNNIKVTTENDVISTATKPVYISLRQGGKSVNLKIVGIYKASDAPEDYEELKQAADSGSQFNGNYSLTWNWQNERDNGLYTYLGVSQKFIDANKDAFKNSNNSDNNVRYFNYSEGVVSYGMSENGNYDSDSFISGGTNSMAPYKETKGLKILDMYGFDGNKLASLSSKQFGVSHRNIADSLSNKLNRYYGSNDYNKLIAKARDDAAESYRSANAEPVTSSVWNEWNYGLNVAIGDAQNRYYETNPHPGGDASAWEAGLAAATANAEQEYKANNPEPAFTDEQREAEEAWNNWYNGLYQAKNTAENAYSAANPMPDQSDYDDGSDDWYQRWNDAYERWNANRTAAINAAEAAYLSENEEPYWDHKKWEDGLNAAIEQAEKAADPFGGKADEIIQNLHLATNYNWETGERLSDELIRQYIKDGYDAYIKCGFTVPQIKLVSDLNNTEINATLAGYYINFNHDGLYLSDDLYSEFYQQQSSWYEETETKYVAPEDAIISAIFVPFDGSGSLMDRLLALTDTLNDDDSKIAITNPVMSSLEMAFEMIGIMGNVFLYAGIVLAVFAFLLMFNFISASITAKKKEIGILRAIGARSIDVFKIFFSEALIIALICVVIAMAGTFGACILINNVIIDAMSIALFVFTPLTVVFIIGIALLTAFLSTIIPVARYSKKPPVESIRAL